MPHDGNTIHVAGHVAYIVLYVLIFAFTILFYNWANLRALLYIGWITLAFGICMLLLASQSRRKGHTTERNSVSKETLVESGMYAFVRHPEFLGQVLIIFALIFISQHWSGIVIGAMLIILLYFAMTEEEKRNMEKFGDAYRRYMQKVPRINLIAGITKQIHYKKKSS